MTEAAKDPEGLVPQTAVQHSSTHRNSKSALVLIPVLLLLILGTAIAPLCAVSKGWAYYHTSVYLNTNSLQIWAGYVRGTDTVSQRLHQIAPAQFAYYHALKEVSMAGQVWGGIEAGLLSLSIIAGITFLVMWKLMVLSDNGRQSSKRALHRSTCTHLWRASLIISVALFASAVVMFILLGVGVSKYTKSHLGHKFIPWPHWAWCIAVINSWLWTGLAVVAYREDKRHRDTVTAHSQPVAQLTHTATPAVWPHTKNDGPV